jgi:Predicted integral membrane protein
MVVTILTFAFNLLIPIIMVILGVVFKNASIKVNYVAGYRTTRSMKNQETWEFANRLFASIMIKMGIVFIVLSLIISIISVQDSEDVQAIVMIINVTVQTIAVVAAIAPVEKALKNNFDEDGKRRV